MTLAPRRSPLSLNPLEGHPLRDARALQRGAAVQLEPTRGLGRFPARVRDVRPATLRSRPALRAARRSRVGVDDFSTDRLHLRVRETPLERGVARFGRIEHGRAV